MKFLRDEDGFILLRDENKKIVKFNYPIDAREAVESGKFSLVDKFDELKEKIKEEEEKPVDIHKPGTIKRINRAKIKEKDEIIMERVEKDAE